MMQNTRQETQRQPGVVAVKIEKATRVLYNNQWRLDRFSHPDVMTACVQRTSLFLVQHTHIYNYTTIMRNVATNGLHQALTQCRLKKNYDFNSS